MPVGDFQPNQKSTAKQRSSRTSRRWCIELHYGRRLGRYGIGGSGGSAGQNPLQQAIDTNAQMGVVWDQVRAHPQQSAIAVGAVASKYPVQTASRIAPGGAVSMIYSYPVGLSVSALAAYGSGFKAAHQNPQAVAAAAVVGEEVCK